jgi:pimeloyl-ACP methyl ester carboxylesterase
MRADTIIYVHGAGASARSFTWLSSQLPAYGRMLSYEVNDDPEEVVQRLNTEIASIGKPVSLVGHSLGGLIVMSADHTLVDRVVTLASPLGGLETANFLRWLSSAPLYDTLRPGSSFLRRLHTNPVTRPVLSIVATSGLPHITVPNDGAVTVSAQMALSGPAYVSLSVNHFEVLLDLEAANLIRGFLFDA